MKRKWSTIKKLELAALGVYGVWLVTVALLWGTAPMLKNQVISGFALLFAAVILLLMQVLHRLPQIRMTPPKLPHARALRVIRLRHTWVAQLKLIFVCGFAGMSLSLLYSETLRLVLSGVFMVALLFSTAWFALRYFALLRVPKPAAPARQEPPEPELPEADAVKQPPAGALAPHLDENNIKNK